MGHIVSIKRTPDDKIVRHFQYALARTHAALDEYCKDALPNTLVMASLAQAKAFLSSVEKEMRQKL